MQRTLAPVATSPVPARSPAGARRPPRHRHRPGGAGALRQLAVARGQGVAGPGRPARRPPVLRAQRVPDHDHAAGRARLDRAHPPAAVRRAPRPSPGAGPGRRAGGARCRRRPRRPAEVRWCVHAVYIFTATANAMMLGFVLPGLNEVTDGGGIVPELMHTWSLAIEVQFYVLWALRCGRDQVRVPAAVDGGATAAVVVALAEAYLALAGGTTARPVLHDLVTASSPLVGGSAGMAFVGGWCERVPRRLVVALGAAGLAGRWPPRSSPTGRCRPCPRALHRAGGRSRPTAAGRGTAGDSRLAGALSFASLVRLGTVSYSLYVWHYGIFFTIERRDPSWPGPVRLVVGVAAALRGVGRVVLPGGTAVPPATPPARPRRRHRSRRRRRHAAARSAAGPDPGRCARPAQPRPRRLQAGDVDGHDQLLHRRRAEHDAPHRSDIGVVAAPGHGDVVVRWDLVVGRVEGQPARAGRVHRAPRVGGVGPDELRLARRRARLQVPAHVPGRQAERAQAADGQVGEVLADATPGLQHQLDRRAHVGEAGIERELGVELRDRARTASSSGRPGGNDGAANASNEGDAATSGESSRNTRARRSSGERQAVERPGRVLPGQPVGARGSGGDGSSTVTSLVAVTARHSWGCSTPRIVTTLPKPSRCSATWSGTGSATTSQVSTRWPAARARHEMGDRVTVGDRCAVPVLGPMADAVAPHAPPTTRTGPAWVNQVLTRESTSARRLPRASSTSWWRPSRGVRHGPPSVEPGRAEHGPVGGVGQLALAEQLPAIG